MPGDGEGLGLLEPDYPRPPDEPDPQTCCQRGCVPCIFDYYDGALERWEARIRKLGGDPAQVLADWRTRREA